MLRTAAQLLQRQGLHATGLQQILQESGAPRGSLYFHFPGGKEQLAAEAVREAGARTAKAVESMLSAHSDPREAVRTLFQGFAKVLRGSDFVEGCPVATVTLEAAASSQAIRGACAASYQEWQQLIHDHLVATGLQSPRADTLATLVLAAIEGTLILSRAHRDTKILEVVADELVLLIESSLATSRKARRKTPR